MQEFLSIKFERQDLYKAEFYNVVQYSEHHGNYRHKEKQYRSKYGYS